MVLKNTLESPLECKEIKPVNPKGNQINPLEWLILKLQCFGHLMRRADSLEKTVILGRIKARRRRGRHRTIWLVDITDSKHEFGQTLGDGEGQEGVACCIPWGSQRFELH